MKLAGRDASGSHEMSVLSRLRRASLRTGAGLLALTAGAFALDRAMPPDLSPLGDTSTMVVSRHGAVLRAFTNRGGVWRLPARVAHVDPLYLKMLLVVLYDLLFFFYRFNNLMINY